MITSFTVIIRLILAAVLGGLIGFERQVRRHSAGLRTHILVCLGSCLIMLTSLYIFDIYKNSGIVDPSRIATGIVTGIGFLCAGTIIRYGEAVKGLTTAAGVWIVAGIGMAVGCGFYLAGIISAILTIGVLYFLRRLEEVLVK